MREWLGVALFYIGCLIFGYGAGLLWRHCAVREWLAARLLWLIGKLAMLLGRLLPRDLNSEGKDKRTGSRLKPEGG